MKRLRALMADTRGDAAVEAAFLFPIIIIICAALVLLSIYLPLRAAMQRSTQFAATAIATERSDTWIRFDPKTLGCYWLDNRDQLGNVYGSLIGALTGNNRDDEDNARQAVINMENRNIVKPQNKLTVEYGVVNYILYKEIVVTATRTIPLPVNLSFVGMPKEVRLVVTSTAVVVNGDEFIRNMDLAVDVMDELFNIRDIFSSLGKICDKFNKFLGI